MADFSFQRNDIFPVGTSVGAYPAEGLTRPSGPPPATAVDTQTMTATGVTFTGLTEGDRYWAVGQVGSEYRWMAFMVNLPVSATPGIGPTGPQGPAGATGAGGEHLSLLADTAVAATTFATTTGIPSADRGLVVIGAYTQDAEVRRLTNVTAGVNFTVSTGFSKAHSANDPVLFLHESEVDAALWGAMGDNSTDDEPALQAALRSIEAAGLVQTLSSVALHGAGRIYKSSRPLMVPNHSHLKDLNIWAKSDYAPDDSRGAMLMTYRGTVQTFTATAADDTFTTPAAHGLTDPGQVVFKGSSLPTGIVAGTVYDIKSRPSATTFTVSATPGGATVNLTADGSGEMYPSPQALCRLYCTDLFIDGGSVGTVVNGLRANLQQPSRFIGGLRISGCTGYGYLLSGQQAMHENFMATSCGVGLALSDASFMGFNVFNVEQNAVGLKTLAPASADPFGSGTGGAHRTTILDWHSERQGTEVGIELHGSTSSFLVIGLHDTSGGSTGALLYSHTGAVETSGYQLLNLRLITTIGDTIVNDTDRGITRVTTETSQVMNEIEAPQGPQNTGADDSGRHEILFKAGGFMRWGALNDTFPKFTGQNDTGFSSRAIHWKDRSGAEGSGLNRDGILFTMRSSAPADGDLSAGEMTLWFDKTNGAAKLMVKAKQADGTVKTANVPLA